MRSFQLWLVVSLAVCAAAKDGVVGQDWPQWGGTSSRNNTPRGENIPTDWNVGQFDRKTLEWKEATNIKWVARLGSQAYGNPVVADGRIYVGTNNKAGYLKRYPAAIDLGVLLCFEESTGKFLWQDSNEKLASGRVHDWPLQGICSTPVIDGDRLWYVNNRGEVVCLDTKGFYDGEDHGVDEVWAKLFSVVPTRFEQMIVSTGALGELRKVFAEAGAPLPRRSRIRYEQQAERWQVESLAMMSDQLLGYQWITRYAIRFEGDKLHVDELQNANGESPRKALTLRIPNQRFFPDLVDGKMDQALHDLFGQRGVTLPGRIELAIDESGGEWSFSAVVDGAERRFRLRMEEELSNGKKRRTLNGYKLLTPADRREADVVWKFDMMAELGVKQHNMANCSMLAIDGLLFVCTSNGVDQSHENIPSPDSPSFMAMDQEAGTVLWTDNSPGRNILHAQWASPSYGVFDGQPQVIFPGGDGWIYSFDPKGDGAGGAKLLWKFDGNPKTSKWIAGGRGTRNSIVAFPAIYDGRVYIVMGQDPEHGDGPGRLWCIDPARRIDGSDVSAELAVDREGNAIPHRRIQAVDPSLGERAIPNPDSAVVFHYAQFDQDGDGSISFEEAFHRSLSIPVIKDDLLYIADFSGLFHCLDAKTGKPYWKYDMFAACWGSALLVDGKVYIGDEDGDIAIFRHSADPRIAMKEIDGELCPINAREEENDAYPADDADDVVTKMGNSVYMTPIVANNVLYIASRTHLFAIEQETPAD